MCSKCEGRERDGGTSEGRDAVRERKREKREGEVSCEGNGRKNVK